MPFTRSQAHLKDENMSGLSATDAASGDSSLAAVRLRNLRQKKEQNKAGIITTGHPEGKRCTPETKAQSKEKKAISGQSNYCTTIRHMGMIVAVLVLIVGVVVMIVHADGKKLVQGVCVKLSMCDSNMAIVEENISSIQKTFPRQEEGLWVTVKATVDYHISSDPDPECPIILLFSSHPDASKTSRCLVKKLGRALSEVLGKESPADSLYEIDGEVFQNQNADQAKMDMDRGLRKAFQGKPGKKVATIFNLDHLPPCSVLLFHGYCDTDNAIFKDVAMIFTVTLEERSPWPNSPKDWEPLVMNHLKKLWVDKCPSLPLEKVEAFLSRITNNVVFVRREDSPKC